MENVAKILLQHNNMIFNNEKALVYITINAMGTASYYEAFCDFFNDEMSKLSHNIVEALNMVIEKNVPDDWNNTLLTYQAIKEALESNSEALDNLKEVNVNKETWKTLDNSVTKMETVIDRSKGNRITWVVIDQTVFVENGGLVLNQKGSGTLSALKFYCNVEGSSVDLLRGYWQKSSDGSGEGVFYDESKDIFLGLHKGKYSNDLVISKFFLEKSDPVPVKPDPEEPPPDNPNPPEPEPEFVDDTNVVLDNGAVVSTDVQDKVFTINGTATIGHFSFNCITDTSSPDIIKVKFITAEMAIVNYDTNPDTLVIFDPINSDFLVSVTIKNKIVMISGIQGCSVRSDKKSLIVKSGEETRAFSSTGDCYLDNNQVACFEAGYLISLDRVPTIKFNSASGFFYYTSVGVKKMCSFSGSSNAIMTVNYDSVGNVTGFVSLVDGTVINDGYKSVTINKNDSKDILLENFTVYDLKGSCRLNKLTVETDKEISLEYNEGFFSYRGNSFSSDIKCKLVERNDIFSLEYDGVIAIIKSALVNVRVILNNSFLLSSNVKAFSYNDATIVINSDKKISEITNLTGQYQISGTYDHKVNNDDRTMGGGINELFDSEDYQKKSKLYTALIINNDIILDNVDIFSDYDFKTDKFSWEDTVATEKSISSLDETGLNSSTGLGMAHRIFRVFFRALATNNEDIICSEKFNAALSVVSTKKSYYDYAKDFYRTIKSKARSLARYSAEDIITFLREVANIDTTNNDSGSIIGYDAGGSTTRTAKSIVEDPMIEVTGNYPQDIFDINEGTRYRDIKGIRFVFPRPDTLTDWQKQQVVQLSEWYYRAILTTLEQVFGVAINSANIATDFRNVIFTVFENIDGNTIARASVKLQGSNKAAQVQISLNSRFFSNVTSLEQALNNSTLADNAILHEMVHAVQFINLARIDNYYDWFIEGSAELSAAGIDDTRTFNSVYGEAWDNPWISYLKLVDKKGRRSSNNNINYTFGVLFLRWLFKTLAEERNEAVEPIDPTPVPEPEPQPTVQEPIVLEIEDQWQSETPVILGANTIKTTDYVGKTFTVNTRATIGHFIVEGSSVKVKVPKEDIIIVKDSSVFSLKKLGEQYSVTINCAADTKITNIDNCQVSFSDPMVLIGTSKVKTSKACYVSSEKTIYCRNKTCFEILEGFTTLNFDCPNGYFTYYKNNKVYKCSFSGSSNASIAIVYSNNEISLFRAISTGTTIEYGAKTVTLENSSVISKVLNDNDIIVVKNSGTINQLTVTTTSQVSLGYQNGFFIYNDIKIPDGTPIKLTVNSSSGDIIEVETTVVFGSDLKDITVLLKGAVMVTTTYTCFSHEIATIVFNSSGKISTITNFVGAIELPTDNGTLNINGNEVSDSGEKKYDPVESNDIFTQNLRLFRLLRYNKPLLFDTYNKYPYDLLNNKFAWEDEDIIPVNSSEQLPDLDESGLIEPIGLGLQHRIYRAFFKKLCEPLKGTFFDLYDDALKDISAKYNLEGYLKLFYKDFTSLQYEHTTYEEKNGKQIKQVNYDQILKDLCNLNVSNDDSGSIIGVDAGGYFVKAFTDIVKDSENEITGDYPTGVYDAVEGTRFVDVRGIRFVLPNPATLEDWQKDIMVKMVHWYFRAILQALELTFGVALSSSPFSRHLIFVNFAYQDSTAVAWVSRTVDDTLAGRFLTAKLYLNDKHFENLTDFNQLIGGLVTDTVVLHEMVHVFQASFLSEMDSAPKWFIEGGAELSAGGIDGTRTNSVNVNLSVYDTIFNVFIKMLCGDRVTTDTVYNSYCWGAIFQRWLFKTLAEERGWQQSG